MINVTLHSKLYLKIDAEREVIYSLNDYFSEYKPGFLFAPKYKSGQWDGKIYIFSVYDRLLPYGLLTELIAFKKKNYPNMDMSISDEVKELLSQDKYFDNFELVKCEPWDYRPYQDESIRKAMKYKKCIIRAATSAGKSYIIAGIIKNLLWSKKISNAIIIVPTSSLVEQFYKDILDYGFFKEDLGKANSKLKQWEKKIVVSTWQTLKNVSSRVNDFDCVIVDEVHGVRGQVLRNILEESNAEYRIGCTGTMPDCRLETLQVKSFLGPVVMEVPASLLADLGYISPCKILMYNVEYKEKYTGDYNIAKDQIFKNPFRLNIIKNLLASIKTTTLLLVGKVETEGEFLKEYILNNTQYDSDNVVFISGEMETSLREDWRQKIINNPDKKYIVIATYGTFSTGINIPNLGHLIFASPYKAKIRILQSIGRVLRKYAEKSGAIVYDIVDHSNRWFPKYGDIRLRFYDMEKFEIVEKTLKEM